MNKRKLIAKLNELVDTVNVLNRELLSLKRENDELRAALKLFENNKPKNEEIKVTSKESLPTVDKGFVVSMEESSEEQEMPIVEGTVAPKAEQDVVTLKDGIMEYGSRIIGKIIVESAKYANSISATDNENKKELVNLIMGKAEVAKAEIFNISTSEIACDNKKEMIDAQLVEATDYFKSVAAQV